MAKLSLTARTMSGALVTYLAPRLAQDAALPDMESILSDITAANYGDKIPTIDRRIAKAMKGRMAADADLSDLKDLLDVFEDSESMPSEDDEAEVAASAKENDQIEGDASPMLDDLKEKLGLTPEQCAKLEALTQENAGMEMDSAWDMRAYDARKKLGRDETPEEIEKREDEQGAEDAKMRLGRDESDEEREKRAEDRKMSRDRRMSRDSKRAMDAKQRLGRDEEPDERAKRLEDEGAKDRRRAMDSRKRMGKDEPPPFSGRPNTGGSMEPITKTAMDAAITAAITGEKENAGKIRDAERFVRPYVGDLAMAFDSDEGVYRKAMDILGIKHTGIHPSALRTIIEMRPKPSASQTTQTRMATDAKPQASFEEAFPGAQRIGHA
jgi:hypothetical protein